MDTSAISSLTNLYPAQKTGGISAPANIDRDGDNDGSRVSGASGGHHHHDGAFMQDVIQSLQSLGLNFPDANASSTSPAGGTGSNSNAVQSASSSSSSSVGPALHTLMHDLHQALNLKKSVEFNPAENIQHKFDKPIGGMS